LSHFAEGPKSHNESYESQKNTSDQFGLGSAHLIKCPKYFGMIIKIPVDEEHAETETSECRKYRGENRDDPDSKARTAIEPRPEI
jgi:hypothetical protein